MTRPKQENCILEAKQNYIQINFKYCLLCYIMLQITQSLSPILQCIYLHSIHLHLVWPVIYSYNLFLTTWFLPFEADVSLEDWDVVLGTVFWATFSLDSDANSVKFVFQMKTWNIVKLFVLHYNIHLLFLIDIK